MSFVAARPPNHSSYLMEKINVITTTVKDGAQPIVSSSSGPKCLALKTIISTEFQL